MISGASAGLRAQLPVVIGDVGQVVGEAEWQPKPRRAPCGDAGAAADVQRRVWPGVGTGIRPHREHPLDQAVHQRATLAEIYSERVIFDGSIA